MRFELTITAVSRRYPNQLDYRPIEPKYSAQALLRFNRGASAQIDEKVEHVCQMILARKKSADCTRPYTLGGTYDPILRQKR